MHFPWWFLVVALLSVILPGTTPALLGFGIGWYVSLKKGSLGRARVLKWCALALAPFWLAGAAFAAWWLTMSLAEDARNARLNYTVREATVIDGVAIPARAAVSLADNGTLWSVGLPDGVTLAASGATWQHTIDFGANGWVTDGFLAADATIAGIPCQHDQRVEFRSKDELSRCVLSRDTTVEVTIKDAGGGSRVQSFSCRAGRQIETQLMGHGEMGTCTLAAAAEVGGIACAAGTELQLINAMLYSCTVARQTRFGPVELPPGTFIAYTGTAPEWFRLPPDGPAVDGFGLSLPAGTEAAYCYQSEKLQRLQVDQAAYVTIDGVKLTGAIDFDCGRFEKGPLFEDAIIGGLQRQRGEVVSQEDLSPK